MSGAPLKPHNRSRRALLAGAGLLWLAPGMALAAAPAGRRVVVVGGAIAEIVYRLGDQDRLIATDTTCTYPPEAGQLPKIGYQRSLSAEGVLAMRPDLLLASAEAGPAGVLSQIRGAGVNVVTLGEGHDVASVTAKITGVAQALGDVTAGQRLVDAFSREWLAARAQVDAAPLTRNGKPVRVLFVLNPAGSQAMVAGHGTAADAMIGFGGAVNALQGVKGYKPMSAEGLLAAAPDVILTTDETLKASGGVGALLASPGMAQTPAGRERRVASLDTLLLLGFGPRLPEAVTRLNQQLRRSLGNA